MSSGEATRPVADLRAVAKALIAAQKTPAANNGGFGGVPSTLPAVSPLVASYGDYTYGRPVAAALPREAASFLTGSFGPLAPIQPVPVDVPDPESGRPDPRRYEYQVGWNMPIGPPGDEGLKLASFGQLRVIADTYSVARACIQVRKNELLGLGWDVVPTPQAEKAMRADKDARREFEDRRKKVIRFFRRPDYNYFSFRDWYSALLEDVLVIDALSLFLHPTKVSGKGVLGSDLGQLAALDGSTIKPLVDIEGARPLPPNVAYQQFLYGVPRVDLMQVLDGTDVAEMMDARSREYRGDQLIYRPYVARDWTPYGFPPVERALVPILSGIQRQQWQLDAYSQRSIPGLFISTGDPNATPSQLRELQDALNAMAGDPAWQHKIIVLPAGSKIDPQRPAELSGPFDEILMTQTAMAFDVQPMELGITPRSSTTQGAANQMAKSSKDINDRKANKPLLEWFGDIFNHVIQDVCRQEDMQWWWEGLEESDDEQTRTAIEKERVSIGLMSVDEARIKSGEQPWGLPLTSEPVLITPTGVVPFGSIDPQTGQPAGLTPKLTAAPPPPGQFGPGNDGPAGTSAKPKPAKPRKGAPGGGGAPTPAHAAGQQVTKAVDALDLDEDVEVLLAAMERIRPARIDRAWDPDKHPRIPRGLPGAGRFMSLVDHHHDRLVAHLEGRGSGDPFDGFTREQLRRVATRRGVHVEQGASRDDISSALLGHLRGEWNVPEHREPEKPPLPAGVSVTEHPSGRLHVQSPYDRGFVAEVKAMGGTWLPKSKSWSVPGGKAAKLDELIQRTYGDKPAVTPPAGRVAARITTRGNGKIEVESPYNAAFVNDARDAGGAWDPSTKTWVFPPHREADARVLAAKHYGADWIARQEQVERDRKQAATTQQAGGGGPATQRQKELIARLTARWDAHDWYDEMDVTSAFDPGFTARSVIDSLTVADASRMIDDLLAARGSGW